MLSEITNSFRREPLRVGLTLLCIATIFHTQMVPAYGQGTAFAGSGISRQADGASGSANANTSSVSAAIGQPVANAGPDKTAVKATAHAAPVTVSGSLSTDPGGAALGFNWFGPFASSVTSRDPSVNVPEGQYTLSLVAYNGQAASMPDPVIVTVSPCFVVTTRVKDSKTQLDWPSLPGADRYEIFRHDGTAFVSIGQTTPAYPVFVDLTAAAAKTNLYVVASSTATTKCFSNVVSSFLSGTRLTPNQPPVVYSTPIATATTGIVYTYDVNATDPNGGALAYSLATGPSGMTIDGNSGLIRWTPPTTQTGSHSVSVRVQDSSGASDSHDFSVAARAMNLAPWVNAGPDMIADIAVAARVTGVVADDGQPSGNVTQVWSKISGPGTAAFATANALTSTVTFSQLGRYVLRLTANDGSMVTFDEVIVTVDRVNHAPVVNAGADQTIPITGRAVLSGAAVDDGLPVGSVVSSSWTKRSGPGNVIFADPSSASTTATFSADGVYVLRLTSTDGALPGFDEVRVTVESVNKAPSVDAGPNQSVHLPNTITLPGTVSDDGLPVGNAVSIQWTKVSGPGTITFSHPNGVSTHAAFSRAGLYVVRLSASDGPLSASDEAIITVTADNVAPQVNAGAHQTITLPAGATLAGAVSDDGLPAGAAVTSMWTKQSGPGTVTFGNPGAASTTATFSQAGVYVLLLTATDTALSAFAEVTITVEPANVAPKVNAGPDQTVALPGTANLAGNVTDDGLPAGATVTLTWTKQSGPGTVTFADPAAVSTTATFSQAGTYVLRLTATDTALSDFDDVTVVGAGNIAPKVNAGTDQSVALSSSALLNGTVTDDALPAGAVVTSTWTKQSGPGTVTFANPAAKATTATFSEVGTYVLRLTASDTDLSAFDDLIVTVSDGPNKAPLVNAGVDVSVVLPAQGTLSGTVTDDGLPTGKTLIISWSTVSGPGTVLFESPLAALTKVGFSAAGTYVLRLTAHDGALPTWDDIQVTATGTPAPPPTVSIAAPADGASVKGPIAVTGSVTSSSLSSWTLEAVANNSIVVLATGKTSVAKAQLGTLDPTLLLNGVVLLRLRATDTSAQSATVESSVVVEGNQKVGNFTVSFSDLSIPVSGLPIDIIRTYDSRDQQRGDFGIGWTLGLKSVRVEENRILGKSWKQEKTGGTFGQWCITETKSHIVTVTLPDGTVHKFKPVPTPQCQAIIPIDLVSFNYEAMPGTTSTLVGLVDESLVPTVGTEFDIINPDTTQPVDPSTYQLTTAEGRTMQVAQGIGLQWIEDLNTNSIQFTPNGIIHSSGKSVLFQRDNVGRITRITDPNGNFLTYTYDLRGDLASFTDQANNTTTYEYNNTHGLIAIRDPRGVQPVRNEYDAGGRLIKTTDPFGKSISFTHEVGTRQEIITDRLSNVTVHEYDANGNVVKTTDALGGITRRTYDPRDNMLTETNAIGQTKTFSYDAQDNVLTETDALGNTTTYTYNANKQPLTTTDALGRRTTNTYDLFGNVKTTTDSDGNVATYTYNSRGDRTSEKNPLGHTTVVEYDSDGNVLKETDPLSVATTFTYDANGNKRSETRTRTTASGPQNLVTNYEYDKLNRAVRTIFPDGTSTSTTYDVFGKEATTTNSLGRVTRHAYDDAGRLTQTTFPDGTSEMFSYDAEGREISKTDRGNRVTSYEYDKLGRRTKITYPDGGIAVTTYDLGGQVRTQTDARGNTTTYDYDLAGRRVEIKDSLANVTTFVFDKVGNQLSIKDAQGNTTQFQYDGNNRQTKVLHPDSSSDVTTFDALGRIKQKVDQEGRSTTYEYDGLGRLARVIDAMGQVTTHSYDEVGNRISQTDAAGRTTRFEYDAMGRRTRRILPLGMAETLRYDAAGNLTTRIDFNGKLTTFTYDAVNRMTRRTPDPSFAEPTISLSYTPTGQRASMTDSSGTTSYSFDGRDRLLTKASPQGTLTYAYDLSGNLLSTRSSNANGTSVEYSYDALNRLTSVRDQRTSGQTTYTYDPVGSLRSFLYPNQVNHTYTYDLLNRLTQVSVARSATIIANYGYALSGTGRRTAVHELGTRKAQYEYDALYRLKKETIAGATTAAANGVITYIYDPVGNRLSRISTIPAAPEQSLTYDANDRLTRDGFDSNGNIITSEGDAFEYDSQDRLTKKNGGGVSVTYDGDGNRVTKTVGGKTTWYLLDDRSLSGHVQVVEELSGGAVERAYTYGLDLISQRSSSGVHYYVYDGHGSVRHLTNASGAVTDSYEYDAFGMQLATSGGTHNAFRFAGESLDTDLNLYFLRARYMDVRTGRFHTADTFEGFEDQPMSLHRYLYVAGDPINRVDPSGYCDCNLASISTSLGIISANLAIYIRSVPGMAQHAFGTGGGAVAQFLSQFGPIANSYGNRVIALFPNVQRLTPVLQGFSRRPDFLLRFNNALRVLEGKYQLPRAGEALSRLGLQLQQFTTWASQGPGREVVVWALKRPDNIAKAEQVVRQAAGNPQGVRFVYGIEGLAEYLMHWAGL